MQHVDVVLEANDLAGQLRRIEDGGDDPAALLLDREVLYQDMPPEGNSQRSVSMLRAIAFSFFAPSTGQRISSRRIGTG